MFSKIRAIEVPGQRGLATVAGLMITAVLFPAVVQASAIYTATVLADGPAAYYRFEEATSGNGVTTLNSGSAGVSVNGTYQGSVTQSASTAGTLGGKAAVFNGTTAYINLGNGLASALNGAPALTLEAWINASAIPGEDDSDVFFDSKLSTSQTGLSGALRNNAGVETPPWIRAAGRSQTLDGFQSSVEPFSSTGTWHHFVGVLDFAADQIRVYLDGALVETTAVAFLNNTYTIGAAPTRVDTIGGQDSADTAGVQLSFQYVGLIDELAVYKRALSLAEIQEHYAAAFVPEPAAGMFCLLAALPFARRRK